MARRMIGSCVCSAVRSYSTLNKTFCFCPCLPLCRSHSAVLFIVRLFALQRIHVNVETVGEHLFWSHPAVGPRGGLFMHMVFNKRVDNSAYPKSKVQSYVFVCAKFSDVC